MPVSKSGAAAYSNVIALTATIILAAAAAHPAYADEPHEFRIAAAEASVAVREFAKQSGVQIMASADALNDKKLNAVTGEHTTEDALNILLAATGLEHEYIGEHGIAITAASEASSANPGAEPSMSDAKGDQKRSFWDRFRVAQVDQGSSVNNTTSSGSDSRNPESVRIEEIVVTAQKRIERAQDVPVPVTALGAESLVANNQLRIQDYYTRIPGFNVAPLGQSAQVLSIRGVTTGSGANPTVGIVVDEVPYGASTVQGGGQIVPDIDPGDLARVEVLRGPQGTLYGANSIGGLLKFVTVDPSTDAVTGHIQAGLSDVKNGDGLGYSLRGAVNVPLSDVVAIRASGFTRQDPGYIDNPVYGLKGVNEQKVRGGRLSALYRASDNFSVTLNALFERSQGDGASDVISGLGDLQQNYLVGTGASDRKIQSYSATLKAQLGKAELTSITGFNINQFTDSFDYSAFLGGAFDPSLLGAAIFDDNKTEKFTQEVRLTAPLSDRIEGLLGVFYTDENSGNAQTIHPANLTTGTLGAAAGTVDVPTSFDESAAFADVTFRLTEQFDVQLGGRYSEIRQSAAQTITGAYALFFGSDPFVFPKVRSDSSAFTYLLTPRFKVSPDLMVYARFASGYRAGGANAAPDASRHEYEPDKTQNYEVGLKGNFLDHTLSVDASVYYIDWQDIQLAFFTPSFQGATGNGSRAKSQGVELALEMQPRTGLTISSSLAWNDAKLTKDLPTLAEGGAVAGASGDRLPNSSRFSGYLALEQSFPLSGNVSAFLGGDVSYVGERQGLFLGAFAAPGTTRQTFPSYTKVDVRAGARYESWTANFFVTNLADERGMLAGGVGAFPPNAFQYIQPRTIGVTWVKEF